MRKLFVFFMLLTAISMFSFAQAKRGITVEIDSLSIISNPYNKNLKAKDFCKMDENLEYIAKYSNDTGIYEYYYCYEDNPALKVNFKVGQNNGYFVKPLSGETTKIYFDGKDQKPIYNVTSGWNLLGFPQTLNNNYTAQDVCDGVLEISGFTVDTIYKYESGYIGGTCGQDSFVNFDLQPGYGYWILLD